MIKGYIDIHTHQQEISHWFSCCSLFPPLSATLPTRYSIGLHPWFLDKYHDISLIESYCKNAFAIGETGLDRLIEFPFSEQISIFEQHITLSETYKKPLIIHCVKAYNELIALKKKHQPSQAWVIHGFNKKPQLAKILIQNGCYLSLGYHFSKASLKEIPLNKLFLETDDDVNFSIEEVYLQLANEIGIPLETLIKQIEQNLQTIQTQ